MGWVSPTYDGDGNLTYDGVFTKTENGGLVDAIFVTEADNREVLEYNGTSGALVRLWAGVQHCTARRRDDGNRTPRSSASWGYSTASPRLKQRRSTEQAMQGNRN